MRFALPSAIWPWRSNHVVAAPSSASDPESDAAAVPVTIPGTRYNEAVGRALLVRMRDAKPRATMAALRLPGPAALRIARAMVKENIYELKGFAPVKLGRELNWHEDPLRDREWRMRFAALAPVAHLLQAAGETNEPLFFEAAAKLVDSWLAAAFSDGAPPEETWHDHALALRALVLVRFWEDSKRFPTADSLRARVLAALIEHANVLVDPEYYRPGHNHGLDQDRALLAIALSLRKHLSAPAWESLALKRLEEQIQQTVSAEGVHIEHTPYYHGHVFLVLCRLERHLQLHKRTLPSLSATLNRMGRYLVHCVTPTGAWPNLGDAPKSSVSGIHAALQRRNPELAPEFLFATTNGREGAAPGQRDLILPKSGVAILRESWDAQAVQIQFASAFNSLTHKHHDDLGFIVHAFGRSLLADAGKFGYDATDPMRQYCQSSWGHNVVIREDDETRIVRGKIGRSGITAVLEGDGFTAVEGEHRLFRSACVRRLLVWVRPHVICVIDTVRAEEGQFGQNFNFGMGLTIESRNGFVAGEAHFGGPGIRLLNVLPGERQPDVRWGQRNPPRGWISSGTGQLDRAGNVCFPFPVLRDGRSCAATLIWLEPVHRRSAAFEAEAQHSGAGVLIRWRAGRDRGSLKYTRAVHQARLTVRGQTIVAPVWPLPYQRAAAAAMNGNAAQEAPA